MGELLSAERCKASRESVSERSQKRSASESPASGSNTAMIRALSVELRARSDEIRNTGIVSEKNVLADPENKARQEIIAQEKRESAQRADIKLSRLENDVVGDRTQRSFIRTLERTSHIEADRTKLVGMVETADSALRRTENLRREQENKSRQLINSVDDLSASDDYFDFLRPRGDDEESENSSEEEEE